MSDFKLEDDIALPDDLESEPTPTPDPRWKPYIPRSGVRCANNAHKPMIGQCTICGDVFPCPSGACGHEDCADPLIVGLIVSGNGTEKYLD